MIIVAAPLLRRPPRFYMQCDSIERFAAGFFLDAHPRYLPSFRTIWKRNCRETRGEFGEGALRDVAALEAAGNSTCSAGFIPLFTLEIPGSPCGSAPLVGYSFLTWKAELHSIN